MGGGMKESPSLLFFFQGTAPSGRPFPRKCGGAEILPLLSGDAPHPEWQGVHGMGLGFYFDMYCLRMGAVPHTLDGVSYCFHTSATPTPSYFQERPDQA